MKKHNDAMEAAAKADALKVPADLNTTFIAPLLDMGLETLEDRLDEKTKNPDGPLSEDVVKGLLALERNGLNRTPYVKALMDRLGVKSPYEVANGGPGYTNDVTAVTTL